MTNDDRATAPGKLRIEPATADHLRALIAGHDQFHDAYGIAVVDGYLEFPEALTYSLNWIVEDGVDPAWASYLFIHDDDGGDAHLIGLGGYKGPPADATVEIGYGIAPAYRGAGHATEAARLLIEGARTAGVTTVIAHTLAEPNASTRILEKHGFVQTEAIEDPDDGTIWRWELSLTA